jgi:hypothetical protein
MNEPIEKGDPAWGVELLCGLMLAMATIAAVWLW